MISADIQVYNDSQEDEAKKICALLAKIIDEELNASENKVWHAHPVWFIEGNPIVGYSKQKAGWRLMFWSGASFDETQLNVVGKKFKDASIFYTHVTQINTNDLKRWIEKAKTIQWDYKNLIKRKGRLELIST